VPARILVRWRTLLALPSRPHPAAVWLMAGLLLGYKPARTLLPGRGACHGRRGVITRQDVPVVYHLSLRETRSDRCTMPRIGGDARSRCARSPMASQPFRSRKLRYCGSPQAMSSRPSARSKSFATLCGLNRQSTLFGQNHLRAAPMHNTALLSHASTELPCPIGAIFILGLCAAAVH
jgi:hypothetical protein